MAGWNLALRFGLEVGALLSLGVGGWKLTQGPIRWVLAIVIPLGAATAWGVFNVLEDPSRSGKAPVAVKGWIRLIVELTILVAGAAAMWMAGRPAIAFVLAVLLVVHYGLSWNRVRWLIKQ
jgi:hypothetical protein